MPRYDSLRKTDRDLQVLDYALKHPDYSRKEIGQQFGLCHSRISQILSKFKARV